MNQSDHAFLAAAGEIEANHQGRRIWSGVALSALATQRVALTKRAEGSSLAPAVWELSNELPSPVDEAERAIDALPRAILRCFIALSVW